MTSVGLSIMHCAWVWPEPLTYISGKKVEYEVNPLPGLRLAAWEEELSDDYDRHFILDGIKNGFNTVDKDVEVTPVSCQNHPSARPNSPLYLFVFVLRFYGPVNPMGSC